MINELVFISDAVSTTRVSGWVKLALLIWNDTDLPLGYLITFRCYGTCCMVTSADRIDRFHNRYKSP
jgi:hypothetical protein